MTKDSMLDKIYEEGFGLDQMNDFIAHMVCQISHRYPRMSIFEIGQRLFTLVNSCPKLTYM